jgi:phosphoglucosamine mutase
VRERLFGTDGIRGRALEPPLDESTVRRLGAALADELRTAGSRSPHVLLAGDTRASTEVLATWFASGFGAHGGTVTWGDVLPTPAVSQLVRASEGRWAAGVVISASHNPAPDNGIKILSPQGEKIADDVELRLEEQLRRMAPEPGPPLPAPDPALGASYLDLLAATHPEPTPLAGLRLVVDAAHGAASGLARPLLERLGATVTPIACSPDGHNINDGFGATAPQEVASAVLRDGAHGGVALDGDADRAVLVDESGRVLDGDDILLGWARDLHHEGRLPGGRVVATVMTNLGLERTLAREGMEMIRCPVGDRAVWLAMRSGGAALGGEQSGHVICAHHAVTGDGLLTATHLLAVAVRRGVAVSELSDLERLPQVLVNVPVRRKLPFDGVPAIARMLADSERRLAGRGRILLRYSGTEPLARVMVEGDDGGLIEDVALGIATAVRSGLA